MTLRRLGYALLCLWLLHWGARELAAYAGRHWLPLAPPPRLSTRQPGRLPGPFDTLSE